MADNPCVVVVGEDQGTIRSAVGNHETEIHLSLVEKGPWFGMVILNPRPSAMVLAQALRQDFGLNSTYCASIEDARIRIRELQTPSDTNK